VFSFTDLQRIDTLATQTFEREHVAPYFYLHPESFALVSVSADGELHRPDIRLCVDTDEDLQLVRHIFDRLGDHGNAFSMRDAVRVMEREPWLAQINAAIEQKKLGE
jgi:spore coat polysaccharide biosynthesis protein SpsF